MKLIGKQIVVELPEETDEKCPRHNKSKPRIWFCPHCASEFSYNSALSRVAWMNPALEVDENAIFELIRKKEFFSARYNAEEIGELAHALASNPSLWLKRKDSDGNN